MEENDEPKLPRLPDHLKSDWLGVTLHSIGDGVIATDQEGVVTFMNPVAESLLCWKSSDAIGQSVVDVFRIIREGSEEPVQVPVIRALREGEISKLSNHILLLTKDGKQRPISDSAAPIRDKSGHIVGAVLLFRDMSEQREQMRRIEDARNYAENILATLRHPFLVLDGDQCVISANRAFYDVFQVNEQETVGQQVYDLGCGQWDIPDLRRLLEEILPENRSFDGFEVVHEFPQIGHRYMLLNARRIERNDQADLILLGIEDTTERRRLEEARRDIELRFTSLVKNIRDHAIFTLDKAGRIASWNLEAERIIGTTEEEALGQEFKVIFTPEDIDEGRPQEELDLALSNGRAEDERWHLRKDGSKFWALGIVTPMYNSDGEHSGYSKILRDITDRKRDHEALEVANQRKTEFLAMLSHELRNPLAPIRTGLEVLRVEKNNPSEVENICDLMQRQAKQLTTLVDDLLNISRITRGKLELRKQSVRIADIVHSAVEASLDLMDEAEHQLRVDLPHESIHLHADPHRLAQVISNLLSNAARYTPRGGNISLVAGRVGECVFVKVQDNGVGIPVDLQDRVFEMFAQGGDSRTQSGLGIGLSLVKSLVEMHHGDIKLESEGPDQGTTVTIRLPVEGNQLEVQEESQSSCPNAGLSILVVDDNRSAADMLGMLLKKLGHSVEVVYSGEAAIEKAAQLRPQAIVLDIGMPGMDGCETCRRIREQSWAEEPSLIALTGWGQDEVKQRTREAGFHHHLVKPPEAAVLRKVLATVQQKYS